MTNLGMIGSRRYQYSFRDCDKYNMDSNLNKIAKDLYGKIQTRFKNINIGDENAEVLSKKEDIPRARFFEFEYEEDGESLGTIAITLDAEDGIVMQVSGDLVDDESKTTRHKAFKFIRGFRQFAKDRLLNFDVQNIGKSNLDKRDYEFQAKRKEMPIMPAIMENKLYGNNRMSYQDLGETRLVIKHSQPINIELPAGRTMHIESIYIENSQGERFKYPFKHINGARALAEHIGHGGNPYDNIGQYICGLSEELAGLRKFKGYVSRQEQLSEAMSSVTGRVIERIEEIKDTISKLQKTSYYESFVESFEDREEVSIPEDIQNDLIDRLTIRTFNEELKSVFPYIYKFIDESELPVVELSADDILGEKTEEYCDSCDRLEKDCVCDDHEHTSEGTVNERMTPDKTALSAKAYQMCKQGMSPQQVAQQLGIKVTGGSGQPLSWSTDPYDVVLDACKRAKSGKLESFDIEDQYESFLETLVNENKNEILSPNEGAKSAAIEKLNDILSQNLQVGPNGDNAVMTLKGLIDEPSFVDAVKSVPAETDLNDIIRGWIETEHQELLDQLTFPADENAAKEPVEPAPAPEPAAAAPAPEATPPAEPTAAAPGEMPPAELAAQPAPVAEAKKDDPPFDGPYKKAKGDITDKSGAKHTAHSQAKHLAHQGMAKAINKAKKAGATLETMIGDKTLAELIDECGMKPADFGFSMPQQDGLEGMLKFVSGFYNKEKGNFPLGGMRIKIKVKKAFEDGTFGGASEEDLIKVLKFIDMKDPTGDTSPAIMSKANGPTHDIGALETQVQSMAPAFHESTGYDEVQRLVSLVHHR